MLNAGRETHHNTAVVYKHEWYIGALQRMTEIRTVINIYSIAMFLTISPLKIRSKEQYTIIIHIVRYESSQICQNVIHTRRTTQV